MSVRYQLDHRPADVDQPPGEPRLPGNWHLSRIDGDTAEELTTFPGSVHEYPAAQHRATHYLYRHKVRTIRWAHPDGVDPDARGLIFDAITAEAYGSWTVTKYSDGNGRQWRVDAGGGYRSSHGAYVRNLDDLARLYGPLTPLDVHNLPALIAEVLMFRAACTYQTGPPGCVHERYCDEYAEADDRGEDLDECSHVTTEIATADDALRRIRAERALVGIQYTAILAESNSARHTSYELAEQAAKKAAAGYVMEAMEREDGD